MIPITSIIQPAMHTLSTSCFIEPFGDIQTIIMHFREFQDSLWNFMTISKPVRDFREHPAPLGGWYAPTSVVSIFCYKQPSPCHFKYPKFTYSTHILYTHTHTLSLVLIFCWSFKGISRSFSRPVIQKAIFFYSVFCNILSVLQELTILPRLFTVNFIHTHTNTRSGALQFVNTTDSVDLTPQLLDLVEVI